jgi:hypothetical protein
MAAAEQKKSYAVIKNFKGLNTKANRTAIDEDEFSWIENAMPIGFGNIKIVPNYSTVKDSGNTAVTWGNTVTYLTSANINISDYVIAFEADGRSEYFNLTSSSKSNVATSGTFSSAGVSLAQYKNERVIIGDPDKGLFTWDGANLVSIGSVGLIGITNPGSGYTTAPTVTISAPNQTNGIQATASATITTGAGGVQSIQVTNTGSGFTSVPTVNIGAPNVSGGVQATAGATIQSGNVVAITVTQSGSGYTSTPSVTITGGGGTNATATATLSSGIVNSISLTNAGTGYTSPPTISISGGGGSNAAALAQLLTFKTGTVVVSVTNGGTGYTNAANTVVSITGGGGTNAAGTAIISGGQVTQVIMTNPGTGYTSTPTVTITGGGASANATAIAVANLNPIVDVSTFSGRVWVAAGRTVTYSAAGSYSDFTSISAGSFTLTDSTLHGNIQSTLSANNFLYIFGDDSINVFSDLRVSSTGQTLFTNTNVSASIGSKRPYAVFPYFRSVLFMNDYGMYALVGSTTSKISDQLDGIFPYIDFTKPVTAGQVLLNNILCAAFNFYLNSSFPITSGSRYVQAVFFEKKWFITSQGALTYITSAPLAGLINMYATSGTDLVRLYGDASANINSTIQTALSPMKDPIRTKQALKFGIEATIQRQATLSVTVDSESGSSPVYTLSDLLVTWINNSNVAIPWTNNSSTTIGWLSVIGYYLYKSDAQQYGKYLGLTLTSTDPAFVVNTFEFEHELRVRF